MSLKLQLSPLKAHTSLQLPSLYKGLDVFTTSILYNKGPIYNYYYPLFIKAWTSLKLPLSI